MTERRRVLLIDDDALVGAVFASHARAAGFQVRVTDCASEFIDAAHTWDPDLVVVDLVMEETDGIEVLTRLAANGSRATVVVTSGMGAKVLEAAQHFAAASGLTYGGVLAKPFRRADVARVLTAEARSLGSVGLGEAELSEWEDGRFTSELEAGIARGDVWVALQPKVSCADHAVVGFEALARWTHPEVGEIEPAVFIPRAEASLAISAITDKVANVAMSWFATHRPLLREKIAINISPVELGFSDVVTRLGTACAHAGLHPDRVVLEVTETSSLVSTPEPLANLTRLRLDGFHLSIDDFGTGYSSMTQLSHMPFDQVKIDRSFVYNLGNSLPADVMVRSMLQLTRGLGMESVAEGVETQQVLDALSQMGCDVAQGFFVAHPMGVADLERWLVTREDRDGQTTRA